LNILIENADSLEYLTETGQWTKNPCDGRRFPASMVAYQFAKRETVGKFNIVGHISATHQFVNLDHGRGKGLSPESAE